MGDMTPETFLAQFRHIADSPNGVQKLRELILDLAVRGKLVPQDPNDEPAKEFLKTITGKEETASLDGKYPQGWTECRLSDLVPFQIGRTPKTKDSRYWDNGCFPWVSIADLNHFGSVKDTQKKVTELAVKEVFRDDPVPAGAILKFQADNWKNFIVRYSSISQ
jgi:type I restriction enzyme S subunit